jgi:hypothetical protein
MLIHGFPQLSSFFSSLQIFTSFLSSSSPSTVQHHLTKPQDSLDDDEYGGWKKSKYRRKIYKETDIYLKRMHYPAQKWNCKLGEKEQHQDDQTKNEKTKSQSVSCSLVGETPALY